MKTKKLLHECLYVCAAFVLGVFQVGAGVDITGNTILQSDTDWREQGVVTIADDATLDLNGFLLQVDAIAGSGRITDSKCYAVLDYVQATGRQRVPTGYIPGPNTAVEVDFVSEHDSNHCLYGTQKWSANQFLCMVDGRKLYFFGAGKYISLDGTSRYRSYLRGGKMSAIQQDSLIGAYVEANQTNTAGSELMYFGNSDDADFAKYPGYYKLYGSRVWDSCELKLDLVPVSNVVTSAVGLFNRVNGELLESNTDVPLVPGVPTGATLGIGSLRVEATSGDSVAGFSGTVDAQVRTFVDGTFSLAANADWRAFGACAIDGCIDLNGHDLTLNSLGGIGTITDSNCPYQRLDYVQATGKQRVPTGYVPGSGTKVEVDFVPMGNANNCLYATEKWAGYQFLCMVQGGGFYFFGKGTSIPFAYDNTTRYRSVLENGQISLIRQSDDTTIGQLSVDMTNTSSTELMYFGTSNNDNFASYPGYYKLYGSRVWDSGELKLDLVPVRDLVTGKVGLRNRLDGTLLASNTSTPLVAGPTVAGSKVETEEEAGSLHVVVPDGATNVNVGLSLKGALKLVKEGGGTLTVMKEGQDYVGGTRIAAGEVNLVGGMYDKDFISANMYIGKTCTNYEAPYAEIVVESNAVFDIKGNLDYRFYKMVLAGGSLRNSGRNQVDTQGSLGTVALSEDSSIESVNRLCFCDVLDLKLDLGGHVLTADTHDASIFFYNHLIVTNGTLSAVGNGPLRFRSTVDARTAKLHVACPLSVSDTMEVGDYYAACTANVNAGTGMMNVYGRFTPATDYFYGCELQNGSVLDLNEREGTWSTTSAFTDGRNRVTFASGATVTIDVHARKQWKGKIVDWGFGNKPIVTFKMSEKSRRMGRMLRVGEDGLYATGGTALLLR